MKQKDMADRLAKLESVNDQLVAEIRYLDKLVRALGFDEGLKTLKTAALELLEAEQKGLTKEDEPDLMP